MMMGGSSSGGDGEKSDVGRKADKINAGGASVEPGRLDATSSSTGANKSAADVGFNERGSLAVQRDKVANRISEVDSAFDGNDKQFFREVLKGQTFLGMASFSYEPKPVSDLFLFLFICVGLFLTFDLLFGGFFSLAECR